MVREHKKRSIAKSLTWRMTATATTMVLVFIFSGSFELALSVAVFETVAKMMIYYAHERAWNKSNWGVVHDE